LVPSRKEPYPQSRKVPIYKGFSGADEYGKTPESKRVTARKGDIITIMRAVIIPGQQTQGYEILNLIA
jgi:hypothetical protein